MKPCHALFVLVAIIGCTVLSSLHSYSFAKRQMVEDMNQALAQTLASKQEEWITPDTIARYRSHLQIAMLRQQSIVSYATGERGAGLRSIPMKWGKNEDGITFQGYANCSAAAIWMLSDQRPALSLGLAALLWTAFSIFYFRRHREGMIVYGNLMMSRQEQCFYDLKHRPVAFTPMQRQLLALFFSQPNHQLSKQEICESLWPKKPDASETLYTLVRRLKPIVKAHGNLNIVARRGQDYQLRING